MSCYACRCMFPQNKQTKLVSKKKSVNCSKEKKKKKDLVFKTKDLRLKSFSTTQIPLIKSQGLFETQFR